jgi:hypothetical protein
MIIPIVSGSGSDGSGYIGSTECGKCHPQQFATQSRSGHAGALWRASNHPLAKFYLTSPNWKRDSRYEFVFSLKSDGFFVQALDYGTRQSMELPIEWAFGVGNHAVTFVSKVTGDVYIEHAFSFYPDTKSMGLTPGHRLVQADSLPKAMGVLHHIVEPQDRQSGIRRCFGCHSTGPVESTPAGVQPRELGIRCEVCHGPGSDHRKAVTGGNLPAARNVISKPSRMRAGEINEFCGSCHRFPGQNFAVNWNSQWNVRHQPPYLQRSRCFLESQGRLTCFTCHVPHTALQKGDAGYYTRKCLECHSTDGHQPADVCRRQTSDGCVGCHMPPSPVTTHLTFVNHWIGVYRNGETLKPETRVRPKPSGKSGG